MPSDLVRAKPSSNELVTSIFGSAIASERFSLFHSCFLVASTTKTRKLVCSQPRLRIVMCPSGTQRQCEDADDERRRCALNATTTRDSVRASEGVQEFSSAFPRRTTNLDEEDEDESSDEDDPPVTLEPTAPPPSNAPITLSRVVGECGVQQSMAHDVMTNCSISEIEERLEFAKNESETVVAEICRVVEVKDNRATQDTEMRNKPPNDSQLKNLKVECSQVRFHTKDIPTVVAVLTTPIAVVRAGRLLEQKNENGKIRLVPENANARASGIINDDRLELWLKVDGSVVLTHVHGGVVETLSRVGALRCDLFRKVARAETELNNRRREEKYKNSTESNDGRPSIKNPLPNDRSGRAFRIVVGAGAGSRSHYFWLRDSCLETGREALKSLTSKLRNPPNLQQVSNISSQDLYNLAIAAPALAELATAACATSDNGSFPTTLLVANIAGLVRDCQIFSEAKAKREKAEGKRCEALEKLEAKSIRKVERENETSKKEHTKNSMEPVLPLKTKSTEHATHSEEVRNEAVTAAASKKCADAKAKASEIAARVFSQSNGESNEMSVSNSYGQTVTKKQSKTRAAGRLPQGTRVTVANIALLFETTEEEKK